MSLETQVAREISYASSARTKGGRTLIRAVENSTGRIGLIRRAHGYQQEVRSGRDFWEVMVDRYGLSLDLVGGSLAEIPATGPLILVANHPYGILDGLIMGFILSATRRGDFRILANHVFRQASELNQIVLPVSFDESKDAIQTNLETRKAALRYLGEGGAIGIFPGGTVATAPRPFGEPMDPMWRSFTAKMIFKSDAQVVPMYFEGQNSRLFQLASHMHVTLRMALLIKEFRSRINRPVQVSIGKPIPREKLLEFSGDARACMDFLRQETYALSPRPLKTLDYGYEFEPNYKT